MFFWNILSERTGAVCVGFGIGGTRIARQIYPDPADAVAFLQLHTRVSQMDKDADIVVMFGGTNDFGNGEATPIGNINDRTDESFYGGLHILCDKVINRYPAAQLVFLTPTHRLGENNGTLSGDGSNL